MLMDIQTGVESKKRENTTCQKYFKNQKKIYADDILGGKSLWIMKKRQRTGRAKTDKKTKDQTIISSKSHEIKKKKAKKTLMLLTIDFVLPCRIKTCLPIVIHTSKWVNQYECDQQQQQQNICTNITEIHRNDQYHLYFIVISFTLC